MIKRRLLSIIRVHDQQTLKRENMLRGIEQSQKEISRLREQNILTMRLLTIILLHHRTILCCHDYKKCQDDDQKLASHNYHVNIYICQTKELQSTDSYKYFEKKTSKN